MATTFKTFLNNDIASTRTMLHEAIPITGSLISGTYGGDTVAVGSEPHIKNYSHGMFQSVYDYPYLSSSANHIFDISIGISPSGTLYSAVTSQQSKKRNLYNQMAQVLMGHDATGSIQEFDEDGNILAGGTKLQEVFFLNFARLLAKDEIKKGSFELELGTTTAYSQASSGEFAQRIKLTDASGSNGYFVNSPAGEYGVLYAQTTDGSTARIVNETVGTATTHPACGLLFYQTGIAVISGSVFSRFGQGGILVSSNSTATITITNALIMDTDTIAILALDATDGTDTTTITATATNSGATTTTDTVSPTFNVQYGASAGDRNATATNLATCLNANSKLTATAASAVVTVTQVAGGVGGNTTVTYTDVGGGGNGATTTNFGGGAASPSFKGDGETGFNFVTASTIEATANAIRNRIYNLSFNNTTELNSSIYFCRANHNDFNYSSNPTYLAGSKIRVKNSTVDDPVSYITTVGLYSADNELLAVAKLSEPLRKDPSTELTLRVRLDY